MYSKYKKKVRLTSPTHTHTYTRTATLWNRLIEPSLNTIPLTFSSPDPIVPYPHNLHFFSHLAFISYSSFFISYTSFIRTILAVTFYLFSGYCDLYLVNFSIKKKLRFVYFSIFFSSLRSFFFPLTATQSPILNYFSIFYFILSAFFSVSPLRNAIDLSRQHSIKWSINRRMLGRALASPAWM